MKNVKLSVDVSRPGEEEISVVNYLFSLNF